MDYGGGTKFRLHDSEGPRQTPLSLYPKLFRGLTPDRKFAQSLEMLLADDDVTCEAATVGSSGADPELVRKVVESAPHRLYKCSGRLVKNHLKDNGKTREDITDADAAEIIYNNAVTNPDSLSLWRYVAKEDKLVRVHRSVRPFDKRNYKDPVVDAYMDRLPAYKSLSEFSQLIWGDGKKYSPSLALPFAMAFDEDGSGSWAGYDHVIGLHDTGFPCFYRRATVTLMQRVSKIQFKSNGLRGSGKSGAPLNRDITKDMRKQAWRVAQFEIRKLYHLTKQGTIYPNNGHNQSRLAS
jgi:hypothetical protein